MGRQAFADVCSSCLAHPALFVIKTSNDYLQFDGVDNGVYGDNVGDSAGYMFRDNDDVVDCLDNLETWNSRWGKAALSWAALRKLEVPTWQIIVIQNTYVLQILFQSKFTKCYSISR